MATHTAQPTAAATAGIALTHAERVLPRHGAYTQAATQMEQVEVHCESSSTVLSLLRAVPPAEATVVEGETDLVPGVYEGGLKVILWRLKLHIALLAYTNSTAAYTMRCLRCHTAIPITEPLLPHLIQYMLDDTTTATAKRVIE
eukprot:14510-Heterococcus_DN1.PRE.1